MKVKSASNKQLNFLTHIFPSANHVLLFIILQNTLMQWHDVLGVFMLLLLPDLDQIPNMPVSLIWTAVCLHTQGVTNIKFHLLLVVLIKT